jgi:2',3'-cyclic-nucleotide 2'-phosphodiesterase
MKKILFFGDVVGRPGREALKKTLPGLREKYQPDFVVVNIENIAHGKGVTLKTISEISDLGIDAFTSGNHVLDKRDLSRDALNQTPNLVRPANYPDDFPGRGSVRIEKDGQGYLVMNLNARVFFEKQFFGEISDPFAKFDQIINDQKRPGDIVLLDFHSEATSEKRAMGYFADGRAQMVFGTHTHVPTADLRILPKGTAHVSDVGMIGPVNSILGVPPENSLAIFLGGKFVYEVEESNPIMVNAVYTEVEGDKAVKIEKIYVEVDI